MRQHNVIRSCVMILSKSTFQSVIEKSKCKYSHLKEEYDIHVGEHEKMGKIKWQVVRS